MKKDHTSKAELSRKEFLKTTGAFLAGAAFAAPSIVSSSVFGAGAPSNRLTLGFVGVGGQGFSNLRGFIENQDTQVLAVCDVERGSNEYGSYYYGRDLGREHARKVVEEYYGRQSTSGKYQGCDAYNDFRELLARDDIDVVVNSTPDHWHVPIAIAAAKAGKDIYCEKPLTLTITEGRLLVDAVQRYGRVLQTGSQQRSDSRFRFACELARNGRLGELHTVHTWLRKGRATGVHPPMPVPDGFDYELWLGPAPAAPYTQMRCHYNFRFIKDYSGGEMTNFGAHDLDIAQWGLGMDDSGPVEIEGHAEYPTEGLFNLPMAFEVKYTYANGVKILNHSGGGGVRFEGTEGWAYVNRGEIRAEPANLLTTDIGPDEIHLYESKDHKRDFLDCLKSRTQPVANMEIGHRTATVCHLGNIAMELGRKLHWDPEKERFVDDPAADSMLDRSIRSPWYI